MATRGSIGTEMRSPLRIGIVAPSSSVPRVELQGGLQRMEGAGWVPVVHPQCFSKHLLYAGTDRERAEALFEFAQDSHLPVIWSAKGGYGALGLLKHLEQLTEDQGVPPQKTLVGFSDSTSLLEFVRRRWKWRAIHGPMPALRSFQCLEEQDWKALVEEVEDRKPSTSLSLKWLPGIEAPSENLQGPLVGGNLAVTCSLLGTSFQVQSDKGLIFFEDISESLAKIHRMVQQLEISGFFRNARAIVLGEFQDCTDRVPQVLKQCGSSEKVPVRMPIPFLEGMSAIWGEVARQWNLPVAVGVPSGHGQRQFPLAFGERWRLKASGALER